MDIDKFNKEASEIFENEVKPQIKNAMRRRTTDKNHVKYRTQRRTKSDWCRYIFQLPAFERLNPDE